jgi:hypothetical protein
MDPELLAYVRRSAEQYKSSSADADQQGSDNTGNQPGPGTEA